ncbi:hypothetical protein KOR42_23480 [Thalassoglobus neptunius]|uniref:Uncharacterized protein n=1 Tax=Thalassoglobus neptunius TaxID=1938619 RepID=A0A5C5X9A0_9PLAN|nr:hypothetical protein [Thalassoglobus neptunius]TWT58961.1 hypothetical protein KOR42_23480 [Thalassoglobus neptunius]
MSQRWVEIEVVEVIRMTDAAMLVEDENGEEVWIPYSQIQDSDSVSEGDCNVTLTVTRWIAEEKDLSYF